jgi:hypothetical protein
MASVSYSVNRGTLEQTLAAGSQTVTVGAAAATGDLSVSIDLTKNWTKREIKEALDVIFRFFDNPNNDNTILI